MKPSLGRRLDLDASLIAVWRRQPASEVIVLSDGGSLCGGDDGFKRSYREHNLQRIMSPLGNC